MKRRPPPAPILSLAAIALLMSLASHANCSLPDLPKGVAVLNTVPDKALRDGILGNDDVDIISISDGWSNIQLDVDL